MLLELRAKMKNSCASLTTTTTKKQKIELGIMKKSFIPDTFLTECTIPLMCIRYM